MNVHLLIECRSRTRLQRHRAQLLATVSYTPSFRLTLRKCRPRQIRHEQRSNESEKVFRFPNEPKKNVVQRQSARLEQCKPATETATRMLTQERGRVKHDRGFKVPFASKRQRAEKGRGDKSDSFQPQLAHPGRRGEDRTEQGRRRRTASGWFYSLRLTFSILLATPGMGRPMKSISSLAAFLAGGPAPGSKL